MNPILINIIVGVTCAFLGAIITIKIKFAKDESHAIKRIINLLVVVFIIFSYLVILYKSLIIIISDDIITVKSLLILFMNMAYIFGFVLFEIFRKTYNIPKRLDSLSSSHKELSGVIVEFAKVINEALPIIMDKINNKR